MIKVDVVTSGWEIAGVIATFVAVAVAVYVAVREQIARAKADKRAAGAEERAREAERAEAVRALMDQQQHERAKREAQARDVLVWALYKTTRIEKERISEIFALTVHNASDRPVFGVRMARNIAGSPWVEAAQVLEPGKRETIEFIALDDEDVPPIEDLAVRFRDANFVWWHRYADGHLEGIDQSDVKSVVTRLRTAPRRQP